MHAGQGACALGLVADHAIADVPSPDILLIPGVGGRMAHEFEEYRPYSNIEQFRREIGKYVDEAEVARLEQYVTLD